MMIRFLTTIPRQLSLSLFVASLVASSLFSAERCAAEIIFVDNRGGNDTFDGATSEAVDIESGPVKSIRRALFLARQGDTIVIANRGVPYYEQLNLNGRRHSGYQKARFTIIGNGAIVSGARLVPPTEWKPVGPDMYQFAPKRKGHYQLILDGKVVPEAPVEGGAKTLPKIAPGNWAAWRGSIYYQAKRFESPAEQQFAFAAGDVGLSLSEVHDITVTGLKFQHFRLDGVSAHSQCRNIVLDNVQSEGNGRAGLFVGETSRVEALNCTFSGNRLYNVLVRGQHAALRAEPELTEPPAFID